MPELTTRAIAAAWSVSDQTVRAYTRQGMPRHSLKAAEAWRARNHPDPEFGRRNGGRKAGAGRPRTKQAGDAAAEPKAPKEQPRQDRRSGPLPTDAADIMRLAKSGKLTLHELSIVQQAIRATQNSVELEIQMGKLVRAEEVRDAWIETLAAFRIELSGIGSKVAIQAVAEFGLPLNRQHQLAAAVKRLIERAIDSVARQGAR